MGAATRVGTASAFEELVSNELAKPMRSRVVRQLAIGDFDSGNSLMIRRHAATAAEATGCRGLPLRPSSIIRLVNSTAARQGP